MCLEKATDATGELVSAVQHMAPQLGIHIIPSAREELASLIEFESSTLLCWSFGSRIGQVRLWDYLC